MIKLIRHWLYKIKWKMADIPGIEWGSPTHLDIELAGKCNLSCTMCPYGTGAFNEKMQGMMPREMAEALIMDAKEIGIKSIKFNFRGEPGLCKYLEDLIYFAYRKGFEDLMINTNMLAFNEKRLIKLANSGVTKVIVSVDGASKETYEHIRVGGEFEKLKENIRIFKKNQHPDTQLIIQMVVQESNKHEIEKLKEITADKYRFVKVQDRGAGEGVEMKQRRRCPQPFQRLVVGWDGTIFPCCSNWNNEYPLGKYPDISLMYAWKGERIKALRKIQNDVTLSEHAPCKNCQVKGSYK